MRLRVTWESSSNKLERRSLTKKTPQIIRIPPLRRRKKRGMTMRSKERALSRLVLGSNLECQRRALDTTWIRRRQEPLRMRWPHFVRIRSWWKSGTNSSSKWWDPQMSVSTREPNIYRNNLRNRSWCQINSKQCWGLLNNSSWIQEDLPWKRFLRENWDLSAQETRWWRVATAVAQAKVAQTVTFLSIKIITWWHHPNLMVVTDS